MAEKYEGGDANRLKLACEAASIATGEGAKALADALWTVKSSESSSLINGTPASVVTEGGQKTWLGIRDAYIANPKDPKIRQEYLGARRKREAERGL